jgi:hypothetical protein
MKLSNTRIVKKIILLAILLFGAFFIVWILHIAGLYNLDENNIDSCPYSIIQ